jgi:hypothetical protein
MQHVSDNKNILPKNTVVTDGLAVYLSNQPPQHDVWHSNYGHVTCRSFVHIKITVLNIVF